MAIEDTETMNTMKEGAEGTDLALAQIRLPVETIIKRRSMTETTERKIVDTTRRAIGQSWIASLRSNVRKPLLLVSKR